MSFFGYDPSKAANPKNIVIDLDGDDLDKALESKYAALGQEDNNNIIIQEDSSFLNHETFGLDESIIGKYKCITELTQNHLTSPNQP